MNSTISRARELYQRVFQSARRLGGEALARDPSPHGVYEAVDSAAALADSFMEHNPAAPALLACRRGCNHCCHRPVGTSAPTVLRIAAALREALSEPEFARVLARVVALDDKTRGAAWTPAERPALSCAFLVDGACSVYGIRPFACRAWNSTDAEACRWELGEDSDEIGFDLFQRTTFSGIERGLQAALLFNGLDSTDLELTAAIRVALQDPDACQRWLDGEPVFAGCDAWSDGRRRLPFV